MVRKKKRLIFLVGPTGVGKTEVSLILAKKIDAEIVSCDSMHIYKYMDIGTQKPPLSVRSEIRHHLIDVIEPTEEFNVAKYRQLALQVIKDIHKRAKLPLIVGGTGLYMKAILDGLFPAPGRDLKLRKQLEQIDTEKLYRTLQKVDPPTAKLIHKNDRRRILRALEVYYTTHRPMSELKKKTQPLSSTYQIKIFGLIRPRNELYARINRRVDHMFKDGFIQEGKRLLRMKLSDTASQAIGYKEIFAYLHGEYDINLAKELIKKRTRNYAKRQLTWFKADKRIKWVEASNNPVSIAERIFKEIE